MSEQPTDQPGIAAAVVIDNGRVLMVRRAVAEAGLTWQFPAGAIEAGEDALAAAARETSEETGLQVDGTLLIGERVHPGTGRHMSYVVCRLISGDVYAADDEELDEVAWVTLEELARYVPDGLFAPVQKYLDEHLNVTGAE